MANFTALCAARNTILARAGWDFDANGLTGAPPPAVFLSEQAHATVHSGLRLLGFGAAHIHSIPSDSQGRMQIPALGEQLQLAAGAPIIVCVQAGNVNTGAFEPIDAIADLTASHNAWIHVDGAFGLWAALSPRLQPMIQGLARADSWATDGHKWLNVPYDSGIVIVKRAADHRTLKTARCAYAGIESGEKRDGSAWTPENSRRSRAFVLYAALREQGRSGIREMIERCCDLTRQFADEAARLPFAEVLNDVVLNQALIRFRPPNVKDLAAFHDGLAANIQQAGVCWLGATRWKGQPALRVSIINWSTDAGAVSAAVESLRTALENAL